MKSWKKGTAALAALLAFGLIGGLLLSHSAHAAKARKKSTPKVIGDESKISTDPGAATVKEHRILKWGPVDPPSTGKNDEYNFRGVLVDILPVTDEKGKELKNWYQLKFHILEVVENEERSITFDTFASGVTLKREILNKKEIADLKKGKAYEIRQWYEVIDEGGTGHAKMMGFIFHQDITPLQGGTPAYAKKPRLYMEEYRNSLVGLEVSDDKGSGDPELKDTLDSLASSATDPQVKEKATQLLSQIFNAQPSGKPLLKPVLAQPGETITTPPPKKGK